MKAALLVAILLVAALVALILGATQVLVEVPMAGSVRFAELSWGGNTRSYLLGALLVGSIVFVFLGQPRWTVLLTGVALGFLINIGLGAQQWYGEKMALLEGMGVMSAATTAAIVWKWPAFAWGFCGVLIAVSAIVSIFLQKKRKTV